MIDIHIHILPGLDDGPRTIEESLEVARDAVKNDVHIAIATPHTLNGIFLNRRDTILQACAALNQSLQEHAIPLAVLPGAEVYMSPEIIDELEAGRLMTLNDTGRYICLELTGIIVPEAVIALIRQLRQMDVTPVITHPERSPAIQHDIFLAEELLSTGALFQIAAGSLVGNSGKPACKAAVKMIRKQLVHFMASDAHSRSTRPFRITKALRKLQAIAGTQLTRQIMMHHPELLVRGESLIDSSAP